MHNDDTSIHDPARRIHELEEENRRLRGELGQLRPIIDTLPTAIAYLDRSERFVVVNQACRDLFAAAGLEIEGKSLREAVGGELYPRIEPKLARAFAGAFVEFDLTIDLPDGSTGVARVSLRPHAGPDGSIDGLVMQLADMTTGVGPVEAAGLSGMRLRRIADANILGIGFWKGERIVEGNDVLLEMLGYTREELMSGSVTLERITAGEYRSAVSNARDEMLAKGFARPYEKDLVRSDGVRLPVLFGMGLYEGHTDQGAFFALDIGDKRRIETALRKSESTLRSLAESNTIGILITRLDDRIIEANDLFLEMIGRTRSELEEGAISNAVLSIPDDAARHERIMHELVTTGRCSPFERELVRRDGTRVRVLAGAALLDGDEQEVVSFVLDMRDLDKADKALRESEERYRAWVDNSSEGIWRFELEIPVATTDPVDIQLDRFYAHGYLAECNAAMARMYGVEDPAAIAGARLGDLLVRTDPGNEEYLRAFVLSGYRLLDAESHEVDIEGNRKSFLNNLIGIVDNGMLKRAWGTQRDITERKRVEREIEQARQAAEGASRSKDRFLATLSHELRTPLTPVVAAIDLLRGEDDLPESIAAAVDIIARNVEMEARLIDDLLDLTRISHGKLELRSEMIEITPLIERVVEICRTDIESRKLHLDLDLERGSFPLDGDASRLQQVFWNLLKNAIKFTPEGGRIWISSRVSDDGVTIEVGDTGIGIDPSLLERIFDPFEQGESDITRRYGGLGLGLAISRMIVTMHGGSLSVRSEGADRGSVFTLTLWQRKGG